MSLFLALALHARAADGLPLWTNRFDGWRNAIDSPDAVGVDDNGTIFVSGDTYGSFSPNRWATLAYSAAGFPLWTNYYRPPEIGSGAYVRALVLDSIGNVFVIGTSYSAGYNNPKYTTVKYSGAGVPLWTNHYDAISNCFVLATAVDTSNNVFITGYSSTDPNCATVAYSNSGIPLWTNRFSASTNSGSRPVAIVANENGSVFISGRHSTNSAVGDDIVTIAYSNTGTPLWTNFYYKAAGKSAYPKAMAIDKNGNIIVTGSSYNGNETGTDFLTISYSETGVPLWTNLFNGLVSSNCGDVPLAVGVNSNGNVYVSGLSTTTDNYRHRDYSIVVYSSTGVPLWTNSYNRPGFGYDDSTVMAVDNCGNVFVTEHLAGFAYVTFRFSGADVPVWTNYFNGPTSQGGNPKGIAIASDGSVIVVGLTTGSDGSIDYATTKYSSEGVPLWTNFYAAPANADDDARALAVDSSGSVVVSGYTMNDRTYRDYETVKYSSSGVPLWTNFYDGPASGYDEVTAVALDSSGNVFVTGVSYGIGSQDYATLKYSSAGVPLWTNRYNGVGNYSDYANALAVDVNGSAFVTGYSWNGSNNDYVTIKYSSAGPPIWTNRYNGAGNDYASALAVDVSGDVFVTGWSYASGGANPDYTTIKYSGAGVPLWTNRYNGPGNYDDYARAVTVDINGNVIVTGKSYGSGSSYDYATIKYSSAGALLWVKRYNGLGNSDDSVCAVVTDINGNVFVTGSSIGGGGFYDYATVKYSSAGVPSWTNHYSGLENYADIASGIAVDGGGNVFVTGYSTNSVNGNEYVTIKYSDGGVPLWTNRYNGSGNTNDYANAIAVDSGGNAFVTGRSWSGSSYDYTTVKYAAPDSAAIIIAQPHNQAVLNEANATFTTTAAGSPALAYQWFFGGNALPGATNSTLTFTNVARTNSGFYSVTVTNAYGSVASSNALLLVRASQRILPLTQLGDDRYKISFADFDGGLLFDWDLSSLEVQGSTNMSSTNWVTLTNALVISNGVGQVEFLVTNTPPQQFYRIRMR
ncbi:MAG: SBBP repeat-containing protein [Verrucomicrobia bacterium]|nr:SBBP repeat-containing protein [Verrucomicrobiota bacterium]